jgi:ABC-type branched-subunit amino acid transport system substrate-binding protein
MSGINRRKFLKGTGAATAAGLAGCAGLGGGGGAEVKLGVLFPETGDLGELGKPMRDAALLVGKLINNGDVSVTVDQQSEDTQTNPQAGIQAANSLVNAGYPAIAGPASSGVNIPVSKQVFIPNEVVGCSPSSTAPSVTNLDDNDYVYRTAPSDALQGKVLAQVATEELGDSTASTMFVNNDYGQQLSQAFANAFSGQVQEQVSFEKGQSSYTSRLESALGGDPDLLVVIGYPESGVQIFKDYYADFDAGHDILVTDGLESENLPSNVGNEMANVMGTSPLASGPARDDFATEYEDEYGAKPSVFTAHSFDAAAVLILAGARAGEATGSAVRDNIREIANPTGENVGPSNIAQAAQMAADGTEINYAGASSSVNFDENGDMAAVAYKFFEFTGDGIQTRKKIEFGGGS